MPKRDHRQRMRTSWQTRKAAARVVDRLVGAQVRVRREKLGITQEELVRSTGVTRATIANVESGKQRLPSDDGDLKQMEELIGDLAVRLEGCAFSVSGPAAAIVLAELAKASEMDLATLLGDVEDRYSIATGELFTKGTD